MGAATRVSCFLQRYDHTFYVSSFTASQFSLLHLGSLPPRLLPLRLSCLYSSCIYGFTLNWSCVTANVSKLSQAYAPSLRSLISILPDPNDVSRVHAP